MNIRNILILLPTLLASPAALALSCGDLLYSSVTLTSDLHCSSGYVALEIRGNNVVLDLNGYTLSSNGSVLNGVFVTGDKVTIQGPGTIKGFGLGVQAIDQFGPTVIGLTVRDVEFIGNGIVATGLNDSLIENNSLVNVPGRAVAIHGRDLGGILRPSADNQVINNAFVKVGTGVNVCGYNATETLIAGNTFEEVRSYGIHLDTGTHHNTIVENELYSTGIAGIRVSNSNDNVVADNTSEKGYIGISLHSNNGASNSACTQPPSPLVVTRNRVEGNRIAKHTTAVVVGLSPVNCPTPVAYDNHINFNKFEYNAMGIVFHETAWNNDGTGNAYPGTTTPVIDNGTGNVY